MRAKAMGQPPVAARIDAVSVQAGRALDAALAKTLENIGARAESAARQVDHSWAAGWPGLATKEA
jgi:hypothetical protein